MEIFHDDVKKLARQNTNFRKVVSTGPQSQLVLMSLLAGEDIGDDVHFADHFILVERAVLYSPPHYVNRIVHATKDDSIAAEAEAEALQFREAHREDAKTRSRFFATERV